MAMIPLPSSQVRRAASCLVKWYHWIPAAEITIWLLGMILSRLTMKTAMILILLGAVVGTVLTLWGGWRWLNDLIEQFASGVGLQ